MAAFQFPDPSVETTVVNPITGSTYQWKEPPGKWVITTKLSQGSDIIYEGDSPPNPRGDYKLWYSTDTLELYFWYEDVNGVGAWVPTSAPITMLEDLDNTVFDLGVMLNQVNQATSENENEIQIIKDGLGQVDLQKVLDNGNIADKSIVLTNASDDALLLSPEEARIMVGGIGESVVPRLELRHQTGILETSIVKLELDEDGKRFDIECDEKVDNIHFRFVQNDKLVLNKKGDAVFNGKVKVAEATNSDEVPTLGQVSAVTDLLQFELDQITETTVRGAWNYHNGSGNGDGTEYVLIGTQTQETFDEAQVLLTEAFNECLENANGDSVAMTECNRKYSEDLAEIPAIGATVNTNNWGIVNKVKFGPADSDGTIQSFDGVEAGQTLEMYCNDGSGFMVAEITKVTTGMWYEEKTLEITPVKTNGVANGRTSVKIYSLNNSENSPAPAPFTWIFKKTSSLPESGEMTCSTEAPSQGSFIKLSHTTSNNIHFSRRRSMQYFSSPQNLPLITIWDKVDAGYRHKLSASVSKIEQDAEGNFVIKLGSINSADNHNITAGGTQWVTVGGFF